MKNGLGASQGIVLFGGSSEIGAAVLRRLVGPGTARVGLVSRNTTAARQAVADLADDRPETDWRHLEADLSDPAASLVALDALCAEMGDIDIAILAAGELTRDDDVVHDAADVTRVVGVNMSVPIVLLDRLATQMRSQGGGMIVLLSTVAMERVRPANALYGAAKAGIDAYARALDHRLAGTGVRIVIVRPGFVVTKMTAGLPRVPLSTTAERVARDVVKGMRRRRRVVWTPGALRWVFVALRHLPEWLWRRLPI